jgi:hypothetical protein
LKSGDGNENDGIESKEKVDDKEEDGSEKRTKQPGNNKVDGKDERLTSEEFNEDVTETRRREGEEKPEHRQDVKKRFWFFFFCRRDVA